MQVIRTVFTFAIYEYELQNYNLKMKILTYLHTSCAVNFSQNCLMLKTAVIIRCVINFLHTFLFQSLQ